MPIECCICSELLLTAGMKVASTLCGHVYHEKCLHDWVVKNNNKGVCPVCRTNFDPSKVIPLHSLDDNETKAIDAIYQYVKSLTTKDAESRSLMEYIVESLNNLNTTVTDLKNDNVELKQKLAKMEEVGLLGGTSAGSDQLRAKDAIIGNLKKEVQDLKSQRAKTAKDMMDIQKQIADLKRNGAANKSDKAPLKNATDENQQPKPLTLSLKFDDISDRMILGDY